MQVGVLGINHKSAALPFREKFAQACTHLFGCERPFHLFFSWVLLSTCNRTELYFHAKDPIQTHIYILNRLRQHIAEEFEHRLYTYFGSDCFFHLARVTAGVDSALVGETEIQGQVKKAYEAARGRDLDPELHFLFQKSLRIGKKVRSNEELSHTPLSLEEAVWHALLEFWGEEVKCAKILLVGLSEINYRILHRLKRQKLRNITLSNRTDEKARALATLESLHYLPWNQLHRWIHFDGIIFATKSSEYLVRSQDSISPKNHKLIIDLSVPRNVDPILSHHARITVWNLEQLEQRVDEDKKKRAQELGHIKTQVISLEVAQQSSLFKLKALKRSTPFAQVS